jgi:hypothetical protein
MLPDAYGFSLYSSFSWPPTSLSGQQGLISTRFRPGIASCFSFSSSPFFNGFLSFTPSSQRAVATSPTQNMPLCFILTGFHGVAFQWDSSTHTVSFLSAGHSNSERHTPSTWQRFLSLSHTSFFFLYGRLSTVSPLVMSIACSENPFSN